MMGKFTCMQRLVWRDVLSGDDEKRKIRDEREKFASAGEQLCKGGRRGSGNRKSGSTIYNKCT